MALYFFYVILIKLYFKYHSTQYPVLSCIARDYLAIQGSSVPSERAFSSGGLTGTALRNSLTTANFEALQVLKSAYKTGIIRSIDEAEAYSPKDWTLPSLTGP